jgi:hypothetical protein
MPQDDADTLAMEMTVRMVAARVGAAAGRPTAAEGRDTAGYLRALLDEVRRGLALDPLPPPDA